MKYFIKSFFFFFCCLFLFSCDSQKIIVNGLDEKEANEIIVVLGARGLTAVKVPSTEGGSGANKSFLWNVSVKDQDASTAMSYLNQIGLPRRRSQNLLGIFSNSGLVPSELQEKIRYQAGLAEQIASTIRKIDGVLDAEVQISFPEEDPLNIKKEKKQPITASVYVKHSGVLDDPNSHLLTKIKRLVAASVTGLDYDNVTVISDRARFNENQGIIQGGNVDDQKDLVEVWSLLMARESVKSFQIIFLTFMSIILLLFLAFVWVLWRFYPVLKLVGIKELFHLHPISFNKEELATKEKEAEEEKAKKEAEEKEKEAKPPEDQEPGVT